MSQIVIGYGNILRNLLSIAIYTKVTISTRTIRQFYFSYLSGKIKSL